MSVTSIGAARFNSQKFCSDVAYNDLLAAMAERFERGDIEHATIIYSFKDGDNIITAYKQAGKHNIYAVAGMLDDAKLMVLGR